MADRRMIHKNLFTDNEQVAGLTREERLLYIGMIVIADDDGRFKSSAAVLKAKIFPFDDGLRIDSVRVWRDKIAANGLIELYAVGGQDYACHPNWDKWQTIRQDRYKPSDCPLPTDDKAILVNQRYTNGCVSAPQPNLTKPNLITPLSFSDVWERYPNKDGRKAAEKSFRASVKTEKDFSDIKKALKNYLESEKVLKGFIKNGSTWFNNWRDWIDVKAVSAQELKDAAFRRKLEEMNAKPA